MEHLRIHYVSSVHATREPYYDTPFSDRSNKLTVTVPQDDVGGSVYLMQQILTPGGDQAHYLAFFRLLRQYLARSQTACELLLSSVVQLCIYSLARLGCLELFDGKTVDGASPDSLEILSREEYATARVLCLSILEDLVSSPSFVSQGIGYLDRDANWLEIGTLTESYTEYEAYINEPDKACLLLLEDMHRIARQATYKEEDFISREAYDYINSTTQNIYGISLFANKNIYTPKQIMDLLVSLVLDPCVDSSRAAMKLLNNTLVFHGDDFLRALLHCNTCNKLINAMKYLLGAQITHTPDLELSLLIDWNLNSTNIYLMQRSYFENYCAIVTAMSRHLSVLSNAIESGLLLTAIVMCYSSSTFASAIALLDTVLLTDYGMVSTIYKNTLDFVYLDNGHTFLYSVLHMVVELLCPKAKKDAISFVLSMLKYKECVEDFSRDLHELFMLVVQTKITTTEAAQLFSESSRYGQNQRLISEFLDSQNEVGQEIANLMNVATSSRLSPIEQMGCKFQELNLGWRRPGWTRGTD